MSKSFVFKNIPALIKHYRIKCGLSQRELAVQIGLEPESGSQYISNIERGVNSLSIDHWQAAAILFKIPIKSIVDEYIKDEHRRIDYLLNRNKN